MKKLILTTLLGIIGMTTFTNAGFESNSEIISVNLTNADYYDFEEDYSNFVLNTNTIYTCVYTNNELPFYLKINGGNWFLVENQNACVSNSFDRELNFEFMNSTKTQPITFNGTIYASASKITYVSNSSNGGGSSNDSTTLFPNGVNEFTPIITRLGNIAGEFIPYIIYIAIGILGISLAIQAVKDILEYLSGKSKNTISDRNREFEGYKKEYESVDYRRNEFRKEGHTGKVRDEQAKYNAKHSKRLRKKASRMPTI